MAIPGQNVVIDLSHHNNAVDFARVRAAGIVGVIHKATQGAKYVDPTYEERRVAALAEGLLWGAYHFGTGGDGERQADHFLDTVAPAATDLLVLDYEDNPQGTTMSLDQARAFVRRVANVAGRFPGLYSGATIKRELGTAKDATLQQCWFWVSQYGPKATVPPCWKTWTMWQYTDGGIGPKPHEVDGVGRCDRNTFNGSSKNLRKLWGAA